MGRAISVGMMTAAAVLVVATHARAQEASVPGEVSVPYPTLENLSLVWSLSGDTNANGTVTVRFRRTGDPEWQEGGQLHRVRAGNNAGFSWNEKHSGSLFGLEPATMYEVELRLDDPDGGSTVETITASTRSLPSELLDVSVIRVTPDTIGDALAEVVERTVLVLANGTYPALEVTNDGAEGAPIVLRGDEPHGAVIEGELRLDGRSFIQVEGLRINGRIKMNDAESIVIRDCVIETPENGIVSYASGVRNALITGNVITGPTAYGESALGVNGDNLGEGVQLTGPGNVISYNRVSGFRDCISTLEADEAVEQVSIDIHGNDLSGCADDAIEADYAMGNVRIYRNRIASSFMGISSQPSLGGPTYFVRNVMYGVVYEAFKLHNGSIGDVGYHNTVVKSGDAFAVYTGDPISRATFRNNLFIGGPGAVYGEYDSGDGAVVSLESADASCSLDYDGYGSIGSGSFSGRIGEARFASFAELTSATSEEHAVEVDLDVFADAVEFPSDPFALPATPGFGLATGSAAVDRGVPIPTVNDGFTGTAPDLGAVELGAAEGSYGPGGGLAGSGGSSGSGGATGNGGSAPATGGGAATPGGAAADAGSGSGAESSGATLSDDGGCSCAVPGREAPARGRSGVLLALALLTAIARLKRTPVRRQGFRGEIELPPPRESSVPSGGGRT